ncbi:helix-turn-helix transcriptional regulator [Chamaesiphon minutus]|uniref:Putative transcriptional regulator n=1 Tax=Chamaesiphon minutus (strain ATCC 27169 / PCC 6605) TaxID=1173020 RepID=K9UQP7_CHAP6|nr:helix-turn-helix transcriptional regulator [Chamaesiphon minutus]AFY96569.1 putative transcriptional regulator [Chamaesiphon minutus PCC 6605]
MAIVEITPDFSSLTTVDRLLELLDDRPDGITIKELSDTLNRPISMLQICLKIAIASRKVAVKQREFGGQLAKVYVLRTAATQPQHQLRRTAAPSYSSVTPMHLREVAGLTKVQLAIELGLSVRTINDWEQKRSQPRLVPSQLKQMMSVYQCTLDELIAAFE